jgi:sigma-B regulation protein RsbQ
VAANRKLRPDFDAVIMKHMGHYPMLERPDEFNRLVAKVVAGLIK